jgi:hypothetical protein
VRLVLRPCSRSSFLPAIVLSVVCMGMMPVRTGATAAKPLGSVIIADRAQLDSAAVVQGTDVYAGDALGTGPGGSLRMKVGASQVYLLSSSAATLVAGPNAAGAKLERGTLGFSTSMPSQLEIETLVGVLRGADGQAVFGQVSQVDAVTVRVSSYEGTLRVMDVEGHEQTIAEGETYEATLLPDGQADSGIQGVGAPHHHTVNWKRVAKDAAWIGGAGTVSYFLYRYATESCYRRNCN